MIQAVLFDMDGTMVDTELLWGDVQHRLAQEYGIVMNTEVRLQMMGRKDREALQAFKDYFGLSVNVDELIEKRREMILSDVSMVRTCEGLFETLTLLDTLGIKKAVATSSFRAFAEKILYTFDLYNRFDAVVTGDDVVYSKPDPEIFLLAAERLGVDPEHCLVLEDAENGVEAAIRAGMRVYVIPHADSATHDFSKATKILRSMSGINSTFLS